jgi:exonuclease I
MRRIQARIERDANNAGQTLDRHQLQQLIAQDLGVPLHDVEMMDGRLSGSIFRLMQRNRPKTKVASGLMRWKMTARRPLKS